MNRLPDFQSRVPDFDTTIPQGYSWLLQKNLVGFEPFTQMEPWYYLDNTEYFEISSLWPQRELSTYLVAFARRQDSDEIACFLKDIQETDEVVVIQGWTPDGYEIICTYRSFWDWVKSVVDDIAEWVGSVE
jgi:hypothetical protein